MEYIDKIYCRILGKCKQQGVANVKEGTDWWRFGMGDLCDLVGGRCDERWRGNGPGGCEEARYMKRVWYEWRKLGEGYRVESPTRIGGSGSSRTEAIGGASMTVRSKAISVEGDASSIR